MTTADINRIDLRVIDVRTSIEQLATAGALAVIAALAAAHLAPTTWLSRQPPSPGAEPATGVLTRRAYLAAATIGAAVAILYGLAAGTAFNLSYTPYIRPILTAVLPVTVCALLIAVTAPRVPAERLPDWLAHTRPAALPPALAAAGILLMRSALTLTPPVDLIGAPGSSAASGRPASPSPRS